MEPLLVVIVVLAVWLLVWPGLQEYLWGVESVFRILFVIVSLTPLGLVMGMPFPLGLRAVASWEGQQVALAWAVNGVLSVIGSILAVALAIRFGFSAVLLAGGVAYGLSAVAAYLVSE
jgi:hypothetical protein